jgi:predicted phosphoribosyltransferase
MPKSSVPEPEAFFADRGEAGRRLAVAVVESLGTALPNPLVLGVPRGGVVVAAEVARALRAPLDLVVARKLGAPGQPELAIGAVVSGDAARFRDERAIRALDISEEYIAAEMERQLDEIRRRLIRYRGDRPSPKIAGRCVILVDDGVATGYTFRAALAALRAQQPAQLVLAVPVGPPTVLDELRRLADQVICLHAPDPFVAVGGWYLNFDQTTDAEVTALLATNHGKNSAAE